VRGPKIIREPGTSYVTVKRERKRIADEPVLDDLLEHHVWFVLREGRLTRDVDRRVDAREAPHVRVARLVPPLDAPDGRVVEPDADGAREPLRGHGRADRRVEH
jgi:hypothetical protein